jgi:two-component system, cell cycle response regulator
MKLWPDRKATLQNRLTLGMGVMLLPLVCLGLGTLISLEGTIRTFERNGNETLEVLFPLNTLDEQITESNAAALSCLQASRDAAPCQTYQQRYQKVEEGLTAMRSSDRLLPEHHILLARAQQSWQAAHQAFVTLRAQSPMGLAANRLNTPEQAKSLEAFKQNSGMAQASVSQLYKVVTQFQIADDIAQAEATKHQLRLMIISGFSVGLGVAVLAGWALARSILRPLHRLEQGVKLFGEGQLDHRITLANTDEFGQLAQAFNVMGGKIESIQKELVDLATLDGLTGVFNRREFNQRLQVELNQSQRQGFTCALIMFDIDHFKKLNDTYGHQAGDEALKCFAALLKQQVRPGDLVARYGGEEFGVILPNTSMAEAGLVAERLREAVALQPVAITPQQTLQITSSIGVSSFPRDATEFAGLLEAADQALYAAKRNGRNQVVRYCDLQLQLA